MCREWDPLSINVYGGTPICCIFLHTFEYLKCVLLFWDKWNIYNNVNFIYLYLKALCKQFYFLILQNFVKWEDQNCILKIDSRQCNLFTVLTYVHFEKNVIIVFFEKKNYFQFPNSFFTLTKFNVKYTNFLFQTKKKKKKRRNTIYWVPILWFSFRI